MRYKYVILFFALLIISISAALIPNKGSDEHTLKVAFYNVENLFDTLDDTGKNDEEFLPTAAKQWNTEKYSKKIENVAKVINEMNVSIIGLAEIENKNVLDDLRGKIGREWEYVHYESKDVRGIDVALFYRSDMYSVLSKKVRNYSVNTEPNYVGRDILVVKLKGKKEFNVIVSHYHSRRESIEETKPYRVAASATILDEVLTETRGEAVLIMGDFNCNPEDEPIQVLKGNGFYNPASDIDRTKEGSCTYDGNWNMYDQILYSDNVGLKLKQFSIFHPEWLTNQSGFYKNFPFRTYAGDKYLGGYSDHFPVYIEFNY